MSGPALSDRTRRILATLVRSYIETGEPVASATLAHKAGLNLSSATVRNVLAQLEDMGYVWQPHTSAGRVPTDAGYRCYVDMLLDKRRSTKDVVGGRSTAAAGSRRRAADGRPAVVHVARVVGSEQGRGVCDRAAERAGAVSTHRVRAAERRRASSWSMVASGNQVSQKTVDIGESVNISELVQAANYLNAEFSGRTLDEVRAGVDRAPEGRALAVRSTARPGAASGQQLVRKSRPADVGLHRRHLHAARRSGAGQRHLRVDAAHVVADGRREAAAGAHAERIHRWPRPHRGHRRRTQRSGAAAVQLDRRRPISMAAAPARSASLARRACATTRRSASSISPRWPWRACSATSTKIMKAARSWGRPRHSDRPS